MAGKQKKSEKGLKLSKLHFCAWLVCSVEIRFNKLMFNQIRARMCNKIRLAFKVTTNEMSADLTFTP